jgi:ubiquitin-like 1-activating enzyme E1 B
MAGNIIPAIATTNAVISGLIVLQALQLLRRAYGSMKTVMLQYKRTNPLSSATLPPPNPSCGVCRDTFTEVLCDPSKTTLRDVVEGILGESEREIGVYEEKRILADPDWDDNLERTLESLNVTRGKFLNIVDDDGELETISIGIGVLP